MRYATLLSALISPVLISYAGVAHADLFWKLKPDFKVQVLDSTTRRPIEGVYAMAEYMDAGGSLLGHSSSWCIRTAGAYTDKEGKVSFAREPTGLPRVHYIKLGYFYDSDTIIKERRRRKGRDGEASTIIYLAKQDPAQFQSSEYIYCSYPDSAADIEANLVFLGLLREEYLLYLPNAPFLPTLEGAMDQLKSRRQN